MINKKLSRITLSILCSATLLNSAQALALNTKPVPATEKSRQAAWQKHNAMEQASDFKGLKWRSIGPIVQGGRVVGLAQHPSQPFTFYAAFASGGLWKTTNNGTTFEPLFDHMPTMIMGDVAVDPNNPDVIWVGTGEDNASRSSYGGMGMYRSTDGGKTWEYKGLGDSDRIGKIAIDPRNSNRIFVSTAGKLYSEGGQRGIYLSEDGGDSWKKVLDGDENTGFIDLTMDSTNPDVLYAASWDRTRRAWDFVEGGEGSAIWKTTDGGKTWKKKVTGFPQGEHVGRIGLALSPSNPNVIYASLDNQEPVEKRFLRENGPLTAKKLAKMSKEDFLSHDELTVEMFIRRNDLDTKLDAKTLIADVKADKVSMKDIVNELLDASPSALDPEIKGLEIYRSDDGGDNWYKTHEGPLREVYFTYGYYFGQLRVAPDNPDLIYALGMTMVKSEDGGKTFITMADPNVHADYQSMWIDPKHPEHMIVGNDGGVDITYDRGETWRRADRQPVGQFYTVNVDMATPYNVYGGLQDNGTYVGSSKTRWQDGDSWQDLMSGDGMYVNIDTRDNKTKYIGYQFGNYYRIDAKGNYHNIRPRDEFGEKAYRYNWSTPVRLSSHNQDVVYFGTNHVMRSMDQGTTWQEISPDLTSSKKRGNVPYATITSISESPLQFGVIWAGTDDGNIKVTANGGASWVDVDRKLPKNRWVTRVEASQFDRNRAYVSLNGYRNDDLKSMVYRTDNFGKTWIDIGKNLPNEAVNVVKEDPVNENVVYVGTDRGVYVSLDKGANWQALDGGLPNVPVHDLVIHPRDRELVAGTHGRSIWVVDVLPVQELNKDIRKKPLHLFYANDVQASGNWYRRRALWLHVPEHDPVKTFTYWSKKAGDATIVIKDSNDMPVFKTTVKAEQGMNQFNWDLLVDKDMALAAESKLIEDKDLKTQQFGDTPVANGVKYGHPLYIVPGKYTIDISQNGNNSSTTFAIKAPKKPQPRTKPAFTLRGKK